MAAVVVVCLPPPQQPASTATLALGLARPPPAVLVVVGWVSAGSALAGGGGGSSAPRRKLEDAPSWRRSWRRSCWRIAGHLRPARRQQRPDEREPPGGGGVALPFLRRVVHRARVAPPPPRLCSFACTMPSSGGPAPRVQWRSGWLGPSWGRPQGWTPLLPLLTRRVACCTAPRRTLGRSFGRHGAEPHSGAGRAGGQCEPLRDLAALSGGGGGIC